MADEKPEEQITWAMMQETIASLEAAAARAPADYMVVMHPVPYRMMCDWARMVVSRWGSSWMWRVWYWLVGYRRSDIQIMREFLVRNMAV